MTIGSGESDNPNAPSFSPKNYLVKHIKLLREGLGGGEIGQRAIDLTQIVKKIEINESIYKSGITVDISVADSNKILDRLRINGTEKIALNIARNAEVDSEEFKLNLSILNIDSFSMPTPGIQSYVLRCVSDYIIENQSKVISEQFDDVSKKIKNIATSTLNIAEDDLELANTSEEVKGIIPKMKPLSAINWLTRNITDSGTPYYFYQTSNGKVHLKSQLQMLEDEHDDKDYINSSHIPMYSFADKLENVTAQFYEAEKYRIDKLNSKLNFSGFSNIANGVLGSKKYSVDIFEKNYLPGVTHNYNPDTMKLLNKEKPFPSKYVEGKEFSGRNFYLNLNSGAFDGGNNYHDIINTTIQQREQYLNGIDSHSQEIVIPGDFNISVGKTILLKILSNTFEDNDLGPNEDNSVEDRGASGAYLISSIVHTFTNQSFTTRAVCKKDSFVDNQDTPIEFFASDKIESTKEGI